MFGITAMAVAQWAYVISLLAGGVVLAAMAALRLALVDYKLPVLMILIASLMAFIALLMTVGALVFGQVSQLNLQRVIIALVLSAGIFVPVFMAGRALEGIPLVNDIMTDTDNPPQYAVAPTVRKSFDNSLELSAAALEKHREHYGDMVPLMLDGAPAAHFDTVEALVRDRGWKVLSADKEKGTVEATVITPLFGFKDDVIIRLSEAGAKTRVDMRSASRQGRSDYRVNATRINDFFEDLSN